MTKHTERIGLTMTPTLKREIIEAAGREQKRTGAIVSTSGWILAAIRERLERDGEQDR